MGSFIFLLVGMVTIISIVLSDYAMYQIVLTTAPAFGAGFGEVQQVSISPSLRYLPLLRLHTLNTSKMLIAS